MKYKLIWVMILGLLLTSTVEARSWRKIKRSKTLVVGVVEGNAPFGTHKNGKGYELELISAIAERLGVRFTRVDVKRQKAGETKLIKDKIDILVSAYSDQSNSAPNFLLSSPYYKTGLGIMVRSDDKSTFVIGDLMGKFIAGTSGSAAKEFIEGYLPDAKLELVSKIDHAGDMLRANEVSAVIAEKVFLDYFAKTNGGFRVLEGAMTETNFVIAVNKDRKVLHEKIEEALESLLKTPTRGKSKLAAIARNYQVPFTIQEIRDESATAHGGNNTGSASKRGSRRKGKSNSSKDLRVRVSEIEKELERLQKELKQIKKQLR